MNDKQWRQYILDNALKEQCKNENHWHLHWWEPKFYAIKLIICILLGLILDEDQNPDIEPVTVVTFCKRWYYGYDIDFAVVGKGVLKNWYWYTDSDGECLM